MLYKIKETKTPKVGKKKHFPGACKVCKEVFTRKNNSCCGSYADNGITIVDGWCIQCCPGQLNGHKK